MTSAEFGYCPEPLDWKLGNIAVRTLPGLDQKVEDVTKDECVEKDWHYAPPNRTRHFPSGTVTEQPYSRRVFALPKTQVIEHPNASREQLDFLVWCLGFFLGMRLTITEAGFIDATPIVPGKLHDAVWCGPDSVPKALDHAERFWGAHCSTPRVAKAVTGIIHSYFLAQNPNAMGFERFIYLYVALDGCHFVRSKVFGPVPKSVTHKERVASLCTAFGMAVPPWADPASKGVVADFRNETLHEGLFFDEPLGFAGFGGAGSTQPPVSTVLQMKALVSRLLFALLGVPATDYIRSAVDTRQRQGVKL